MKIKICSLAAIIFLVFIFQSCSSKNNSTNPPAVSNTNTFPNSTGDKWTYAVYDSTSNVADTMTVTVTGSKSLPDGRKLEVWSFRSLAPNRASYLDYFGDSLFVYSGQDTVFLYSDNQGTTIHTDYVFPLSLGLAWANPLTGIIDSSSVTEKGTVTTPAGTFDNSYLIERFHTGLNDYVHSKVWFKDNVGIIKMDVDETGFLLSRFSCQLISYDVNQ
jgi:hypothetical protein